MMSHYRDHIGTYRRSLELIDSHGRYPVGVREGMVGSHYRSPEAIRRQFRQELSQRVGAERLKPVSSRVGGTVGGPLNIEVGPATFTVHHRMEDGSIGAAVAYKSRPPQMRATVYGAADVLKSGKAPQFMPTRGYWVYQGQEYPVRITRSRNFGGQRWVQISPATGAGFKISEEMVYTWLPTKQGLDAGNGFVDLLEKPSVRAHEAQLESRGTVGWGATHPDQLNCKSGFAPTFHPTWKRWYCGNKTALKQKGGPKPQTSAGAPGKFWRFHLQGAPTMKVKPGVFKRKFRSRKAIKAAALAMGK